MSLLPVLAQVVRTGFHYNVIVCDGTTCKSNFVSISVHVLPHVNATYNN
jgi:hypothetical protein